jgi:hypothetical protein
MHGRQRRRHSRGVLEAMPNGDVLDPGEFSKAMRIAGADIVEFDSILQPAAQAIDSAEHQRRILEFIQPAREHDPKWDRADRKRLRLKYIGIDPGPQRVDLVLSTRIGPL